jgi:Tol biopolymer transport system component
MASGSYSRKTVARSGRRARTGRRRNASTAFRFRGIRAAWIDVLPDASSIAYFMREVGPIGDFWIVPSIGGTPRQLTHDFTEAGGPIWTADGQFVIFSSMRGGSRTLWRVPAGAAGVPER